MNEVDAWRNFLNEGPTDNSTIAIASEEFANAHVLVIYDLDRASKLFSNNVLPSGEELSDCVIGVTKRTQDGLIGDCMGAWEIFNAAVAKAYQGRGFGSLLYRMTMADTYPDPIMSDRTSTSPAAQRVWASLARDKNVEKLPSKEDPYMGIFDDPYVMKTPPTDDDCDTVYKQQQNPVLMRAYRSDAYIGDLNKYKKNHLKFLKLLEDKFDEGIADMINTEIFRLGANKFDETFAGML